MSKRPASDLHAQALRLPKDARDHLAAVVDELHAAGFQVSAAEATRGLCLLALEIARGGGGATIADIFRFAASDPTAPCVRSALDMLLWLLDVDPITRPVLRAVRVGERGYATTGSARGLHNQALRVPKGVRDQLETLAVELRAAGASVTAAHVTRGLCLLALEILHRAAGTDIAHAFRLAASDPSADGARAAFDAVQALLDGVPSTMPDPPPLDEPTPTTPRFDSTPPSTIPNARAA